jgi:hypothetical protein
MNGAAHFGTGPHGGRIKRRRLVILAAVFLALVAVGAVAIAASKNGEPGPPCPDDEFCPGPPSHSPELVSRDLWRSSELGFQFEFDKRRWSTEDETPRSVKFHFKSRPGEWKISDLYVVIGAVPAKDASPSKLLDDQLSSFRGNGLSVDADAAALHQIRGANIADRQGTAGTYVGTTDTPQGPGKPLVIEVMTASDGKITAFVELSVSKSAFEQAGEDDEEDLRRQVLNDVDSILNTFRWPSEAR